MESFRGAMDVLIHHIQGFIHEFPGTSIGLMRSREVKMTSERNGSNQFEATNSNG